MRTLKSLPTPTQVPKPPTLQGIADGLEWFVEQGRDLQLLAEALHDVTLECDRPQDHEKLAVVSEALAWIVEQRAGTLQEGIAGAQKQLKALSAAAA